jgi:tetratricopeptide (TPR) repeat protein
MSTHFHYDTPMPAQRRTSLKLATLAATLLATSLAIPAQTQDTFNDAFNQGIAAFKAGHYNDAATAFQKALDINPKSTTVRLNLCAAYAYQVAPSDDTPSNLAAADKAIAICKQIPTTDPEYHTALKQIATLYRNTKRLGEARDAERAALKLQPGDAPTHYTIGVIDWMQAYQFAVATLGSQGLTDDGLGNTHMTDATCARIRTHNAPLVDEAITELSRAVELDPAYSDAMQYLNLIYRRKADFDCASSAARAQDLALADKWTSKAIETKTQSPPATAPK